MREELLYMAERLGAIAKQIDGGRTVLVTAELRGMATMLRDIAPPVDKLVLPPTVEQAKDAAIARQQERVDQS